ncbi:MAG: bifunctional phosphoribosyl-AMP cyclohydrolase/phosphoribosyl-ATP diphosphatase HisIE [Caulobacteraceae bacterium]
MTPEDIARVDFDKGGGLVPAIIQDAATLQVLMLAYMDRAAMNETLESGEVTFFSRSRGGRWRKGETSGHRMLVKGMRIDCDGDTLLVWVTPQGPACHLGTTTCFGDGAPLGLGRLAALERTIARRATAPAEESWTARLLAQGAKRVAQKVGEEGVECALAGAVGDAEELREEAADLLYHLAVLLHARDLSYADVMAVLTRRAESEYARPGA